MTPTQEQVLALVSGYPRSVRERRLFMVLQLCIDDSATHNECQILAGYVSTVENWLKFSDQWADLLTMRPPWKRFKMSEIMATNPGVETMERVAHHYALIEDFALAAFCVAIPTKPLGDAVRELRLPPALSNPYYLAWRSIVYTALGWMHQNGVREQQIDFIFDEQSELGVFEDNWDRIRAHMPPEFQSLIVSKPIGRSDEKFLPLQAADLLAWWMRKRYLDFGTILHERFPFPWKQRKEGPPMLQAELTSYGIRKQLKSDIVGVLNPPLSPYRFSAVFSGNPGAWRIVL